MTFQLPRQRVTFVLLAACFATQHSLSAGAATAALEPASGSKVKGEVTFSQDGPRVRAIGEITGLTPGRHGMHLHEKGDCSAPDASSATYNPEAGSTAAERGAKGRLRQYHREQFRHRHRRLHPDGCLFRASRARGSSFTRRPTTRSPIRRKFGRACRLRRGEK